MLSPVSLCPVRMGLVRILMKYLGSAKMEVDVPEQGPGMGVIMQQSLEQLCPVKQRSGKYENK